VPDEPKRYVQDRIRERSAEVAYLLADENCYATLRPQGMEQGVGEAFRDACREHGKDGDALLSELRANGRYHVETC